MRLMNDAFRTCDLPLGLRLARPPAARRLLALTAVACFLLPISLTALAAAADATFPIPLFSGRVAVLPDPAQADLRRSPMGQTLASLGLDRHVVYLTPEQLVDPAVFNAEAFPVALYLCGEIYWQTVREPEDGDAALLKHLRHGGRLLVLPSGPLPFCYNQAHKPVGSAGKFGMRMGAGAFSEPPEGRSLAFHRDPAHDALAAFPDRFPFPLPHEADQRWRPINGPADEGARYVPWLTLRDETDRTYGEGAAAAEFDAGGRVLYVWSSLLAREEARRTILMAALRYALAGLEPPPARLNCLRTFQPPAVDGALGESIWRVAPAASPFVVCGGRLRAASPQTVMKACWDDAAVYLAIECEGAGRDAQDDAVELWFGGEGGDPGLQLTLNAANELVIRPQTDGPPESAIRSAVKRRDGGWTAEIAIPFHRLAASPSPRRFGQARAVQFARRVATEPGQAANVSVWSATDDPARTDRFGSLVWAAHPWSDDFDAYPASANGSSQWNMLGGNWRIEQGEFVGQDGCADWSRLVGALRGEDRWRDYSFSARFRIESRGSGEYDGPWFGVRCSPEGDGYLLQFGARAWYLHKIVYGVATRPDNCLAQGPWTPGDAWHTLRLETRGNRIKGELDGSPLFDVMDDAHLDLPSRRRGGILLAPGKLPHSEGTTIVRYDDVVVQMLED